MLRIAVTLGAESRIGNFEQAIVNRAMGLVAVRTIFPNRWVFVQEGSAPFRMAQVTGFIDARLFELRRVGSSVRVMAVRTGQRPFSQRHVGRALELRLSLQVALAAHFRLGSLIEKNRLVPYLRQLETISGLFHDRMAIDAGHSAPRVRTRPPVSLDASLVAAKADIVLHLRRLSRVFAKCDQPADAFASTGGNVIASWTVAALAGLLLHGVARIVEKNFPHHGSGKFFKGWSVASFANFIANVGSWIRFGRLFFRRHSRVGNAEQKQTYKRHEKNSSHDSPVSYSAKN